MHTPLMFGTLAAVLLSSCTEEKSSVTERYYQIIDAFPASSSRSIECDFFWGTRSITEGLVCDVRDDSRAHASVLLLVYTFEGNTGPAPIFAVRSLGAIELYDDYNTVMPFLPNDIRDVYGVYDMPTTASSKSLFGFTDAESEITFIPDPGLTSFINDMLEKAAEQ
jgi:hypothetical protein